MINGKASGLESFDFRGIHPRLLIGTMSDRYAGWIGQIYSSDRYAGRITRRNKRVGKVVFKEDVLPVSSVEEYFRHFPVLEIDFTFYRPLLDGDGEPESNYHVLRTYRGHLKPENRLFLKVPQAVCAPRLRRGKICDDNPDYLNPDFFLRRFYRPALDLLGENLAGLIFEQAYQRKQAGGTAETLAAELDTFFEALPTDPRFHVEIRTDRLLRPPVIDMLRGRGVGLVLSHWTWLPALREQAARAGGWFASGDGARVIRLITPRGMTYEQTYAAAHPFSGMVAGMLHDAVVEETLEIIRGAVREGSRLYLFVNNRAGGNAPLTAQRIGREFLAAAG